MTNYLTINKEESCYGCRACEHVCPKGAIAMQENGEGFLYPVLDETKCIQCGLCKKVCPYDNNQTDKKEPLSVYAAQYQNAEALKKSTSGGMFSAFADYVLENGGAVAGCIFDKDFNAIHVVTKDLDVVAKMRGSKYVQSNTGKSYPQIKDLLESGVLVLFTGTPCQVDGLKRYLRKDYDNLFTLDLICHGVPSQKMLGAYLDSVRKEKGEVLDLKFRDKERNGWSEQGSIVIEKKIKTISGFNNSYYQYFLKSNLSRPCCYACKYSSIHRVGDITIGDYWNIGKILPALETKDGYSVILVNSSKGEELLGQVKDRLKLYETDLISAVKGNGNLSHPSEKPATREDIYKRVEEEGYAAVAKQDCKYSYVVPFIKRHTPRWLKKLMRKIKK